MKAVGIVNNQQRAKQSNWPFYQLRKFLTYKAKRVNIEFVNPANTSSTGHQCGRTEKANRKSMDMFFCRELGYRAMAGSKEYCLLRERVSEYCSLLHKDVL